MAHVGVSTRDARAVDVVDAVGLEPGDPLADAVERHVARVAAFDKASALETVCSLAKSAEALAPLLAAALGSQHSALLSTNSADLDAFDERIERADQLLVGIGLQVGAEAVYSYVRYDELADTSGMNSDEFGLFRELAGLWRNPTGWPIYIEQQTDIAGCADPGALVEPLAILARTWARAPECVRTIAMDAVRRALREVSTDTACYCGTRDQTAADFDRLVDATDAIGLRMSKAGLVALPSNMRQDEIRFECRPN